MARRPRTRPRCLVPLLFLLAAGLSTAACGGGGGSPASEPEAGPGVERLSAACREYVGSTGRRLPPASTRAYVEYLFDRTEAADRLAAVVRKVEVTEPDRAKRGALLAAASEIQTQLVFLVRADNPGYQKEFLGERLIRGSGNVLEAERLLARAADRAGLKCAPPSVAPEARKFAGAAGEACEKAGALAGDPRRDADALRTRAEGLAALKRPARGGELADRAVQAEQRLAEAAGRARGDLETYAVAGAVAQELWSRQGVGGCAAVFG